MPSSLTWFTACVRRIVLSRLLDLGLEQVRLPLGVSESDKHIPILVSKGLAAKKHIVVLFTDRYTDPGVLSYRVTGDEGINIGSLVNFTRAILHGPGPKPPNNGDQLPSAMSTDSGFSTPPSLPPGTEQPGLIIANPSQLLWYRGGGRPVTDREWMCLPRETAVHQPFRIDEVKNRVIGNRTFQEHIQYVFEHVLSSSSTSPNPAICNSEAKFSIIGLEYVGSAVLQYIVDHWSTWSSRISCVALMTPQHTLTDLLSSIDMSQPDASSKIEEITSFIARRTRAYRMSPTAPESILSGREKLGCNMYASGETLYEENVLVRCWPRVLDWIELCRFSETYAEPVFEIRTDEDEEAMVGSPRRANTQLKDVNGIDMQLTNEGIVKERTDE